TNRGFSLRPPVRSPSTARAAASTTSSATSNCTSTASASAMAAATRSTSAAASAPLAPGTTTMVFSPRRPTVMRAVPVGVPGAVRTSEQSTPARSSPSRHCRPKPSSPTQPTIFTCAPASAAAAAWLAPFPPKCCWKPRADTVSPSRGSRSTSATKSILLLPMTISRGASNLAMFLVALSSLPCRRRRAGAAAHDQLRRQHLILHGLTPPLPRHSSRQRRHRRQRLFLRVRQQPQHGLHGQLAHALDGLPDDRQRRPQQLGERRVVEPHHGEVVRNRQAVAEDALDEAVGAVLAGGDDGRGPLVRGQCGPGVAGLDARLQRILAAPNPRRLRQAVGPARPQ